MSGKREDAGTDRIVRRKLSDEVFDRLRRIILEGDLSPGDPVPSERELMQRFGVGRPAVREALQTMDTMGLITISHGERSRVNQLSPTLAMQQMDAMADVLLSADPATLEDLKEARRHLEQGVVKIAAQKRTDADIADLRDILERQRAVLGDAPAFIRADIEFHARIAAITQNPIMTAVSGAMLKWMFRYHTSLLLWSGNEHVTLDEHARIVDALAARDVAECARVMAVHLDRSADLYRHHV